MKKLLTIIIASIASMPGAFAQQDAAAKAILSQISQKYRSYDVVKTDFVININNPQDNMNETQSGSLLAKTKANKYKLSIFTGSGAKAATAQEIISDGKTQWTYSPQNKEVQVNNAQSGADAMNPSQLFSLYEKGYKYIYTGNQKVGKSTYQAIELTPTDAQKSIFKIKLLVDKVKKQIYSAQLFDKSGSRYTYTIRSFTPNVKATDASFSFNPKSHPGVEVVDLR